jgi:hypothetical protein
MRFLLASLLLVAAPAWAEWVKVGTVNKSVLYVFSNETVYYIDPSTITREGSIRRVWEIHDLDDKGPQGERSVLASVEYDCAETRMRTLNATGRSMRMARGEIIPLRGIFSDWVILRPGKDDEVYLKILNTVCAR